MTDARVARLTITAPDDAQVRRGAILVEDAMRIATLAPDSDRRAYIVRHLDVGVIDPDAPSHTLALQIERRLAHAQRMAVPALGAEAATARAVWFPDETIAVAELARRLATGTTPHEWFWPHVAGGAIKRTTTSEALRACLAFTLRRPEGPLAVAALIEAVEHARDGALLGALQPADGDALLHATFGGVPELGMPDVSQAVLATLAPRWRARLRRWIAAWGADARSLWLAVVAVVASRGSIRSAHAELARARDIVGAMLARQTVDGAPHDRQLAAIETRAAPPVRAATGIDAVAAPPRDDVSAPDHAPPTAVEVTVETAAAGALFLLRPLALLGISEWLDEHAWTADASWPAQLLSAIVAEHASPGDPLAIALSEEPLRDGPFAAPPRWRGLLGHRPHRLRLASSGTRVLESFGRLPLAVWRDERPDLDTWRTHAIRRGTPAPERAWAAFAWQRALGRWVRTFTRLSLAQLVQRRATIASTPTHLDVIMPLRAADVRIRAAGLDIDPGWVPWLGRVVRFHYREDSP